MPRLLARALAATLALSSPSLAQPEPPVTVPPVGEPPPAPVAPSAQPEKPPVSLSGYVEAFYQYNLAEPGNGITNLRGFDNRHNSLTLANAVLDASLARGPVTGRVALQIGHTPETYYLAEPSSPGGPGAGSTGMHVWKYLQQANIGYRGGKTLVEAGLFLSPIGVEAMAIKDNFNFSRSNLFFGLPFYHTGARITYAATERLALWLAVFNGYNSVVDNNAGKSVAGGVTYTVEGSITASLLYFGGPERSAAAREGEPWRSMVDLYVLAHPYEALSFYVQGNAGFEETSFGTARWGAAAAAARVRLARPLFVAARTDVFYEEVPSNGRGRALPIFWPVDAVSSQTVTLDGRPADNLSVRLEYRHDAATGDAFYGGDTRYDRGAQPIPDRKSQDTVTLGAVAWF